MKKILRYGYFVLITVFGVISLGSLIEPAYGQWSTDPNVNNAISITGKQYKPKAINDGSGGAIITWEDDQPNYDIYAQRINANGHALWVQDGVTVCQWIGMQTEPEIISDGSGGAIIGWEDTRGTSIDIFVERINENGTIQWQQAGVPICEAPKDQKNFSMVGDGSGGAIITWEDNRNSSTGSDIYAQRINANGQVQWTSNGVPVCIDTLSQSLPQIVSDGSGGAIITWGDWRNGKYSQIYAQWINSTGVVQWPDNGIAVSGTTNQQIDPQMISDESGGAFITWAERRDGIQYDLYAQRLSTQYYPAPQWNVIGGKPICTATGAQYPYQIINDGKGGAIVTWSDNRSGSNVKIYAQRINGRGSAYWTSDGVPISKSIGGQVYPQMVSDDSHGAVVVWNDYRTGSNNDIYAQRVRADGSVSWTSDGVPISTATGSKGAPQIIGGGSGSAIIIWEDGRHSIIDQPNYDIYAQKVDRFGYLGDASPTITQVQDVPGDQGGKVTVSWDASPYDVSSHQVVTGYSIWRGVDRQTPPQLFLKNAPSSGMSSDFTQSAGGTTYRIRTVNGLQTTWEWLADVPSHDLKHYSYTAATTSDSSGSGTPYFKYFVSAQTANSFEYWDSQADSGYSVDNLAPNAPANVMGSAVAGTVELHWNPNSESDLGGYDVFRGSAPGFNPDTMSTYATTTDTAYTDSKPSSSGTVYYVVRAVDVHGNQSPSSNEASVHLTAVQDNQKDGLPTTFALKQNYPNPFNPTTVIPYQLASKSHVTLTIYNVLGQQVVTLVNSDMKAGRYQARWDAHDMPSGVYIYLLRAGSFMQSRKLILIK